MPLANETNMDIELPNDKEVKFDIVIGRNIRLVNEGYNAVKKKENAVAIEWMIRGDEALRDYLTRIAMKGHRNLGQEFSERLARDKKEIIRRAKQVRKSQQDRGVEIHERPSVRTGAEITLKWVKGTYVQKYPTINLVMPLDECTHRKRYFWEISLDVAVEVGYKMLYWISVTDYYNKGRFEIAEKIL